MTNQQEIYAELVKLSEPASLPAPWTPCEAAPTFRAPLPDLATVAALRAKFSEQDLLAAGVVVHNQSPAGQDRGPETAADSGLVRLHPGLLLSPWLVVRPADDLPPYELVTELGCLSGPRLPLFAVLDDASTIYLLEANGDEILGTNSLTDTLILQSLGVAAAPTRGLDKLEGAPLDEFCRWLNVRSLSGAPLSDDDSDYAELPVNDYLRESNPSESAPNAAPSRSNCRVNLTLVNWQPSELSAAKLESVESIRSHLAEVAGYLDLLIDQVSIWEPTSDTMGKVRWSLTHATPRHTARIVLESLEKLTRDLFPRRRRKTTDDLDVDHDVAANHTAAGSLEVR